MRQRRRISEHPAFPVASGMLVLVVYLTIAWWVLPHRAVWSPDEGAKLLQLSSLRWQDGRLAYDIEYGGRELDPDLRFARAEYSRGLLSVVEGKLYLRRLPLFTLLTLPFFRLLDLRGLYVLPALAGAASSTLTFYLVRPGERRLLMWVLAALGSPLVVYSTLFWEHTLAVGLGLGAACLAFWMESSEQPPPALLTLGWTLVGLLLSASVYLRLEMAIYAGSLLLAFFVIARRCRWGAILAGALLVVAVAFYSPLHQNLYGQSLPDNARYLFHPFFYLGREQWRAIPDLLIGPPVDEAIDAGWLGTLWSIAAVVALAHSFSKGSPAAHTVRLVALAITVVCATIFLLTPTPYRSAHGLLFTTPWALVGVCRARDIWRQGHWRARVIVLTTVLGLIGYSVGIVGLRAAGPHGGLEWGARFVLVFYPFVAVMTAWDWNPRRQRMAYTVIVGALVLLGLAFQVRGIATIGHDKRFNLSLNEAIARTPEQYVVTSLWWIPFNAAPLYPEKTIVVPDTGLELQSWAKMAQSHQIEGFCWLTYEGDPLSTVEHSEAIDPIYYVIEVRDVGHLELARSSIIFP